MLGHEPPIDLPATAAEAEARGNRLRNRLTEIVGPLPATVPLESRVLAEARYSDRTEYRIEYLSDADDAVSAFLLVPRRPSNAGPAVVAHHQCNIDCDIGKDAVVGRTVDRPDQAYGLELVRRGYVVLAPDTKSCGERPAPGFREVGECERTNDFKHQHCYWGAHIAKTLKVRSFVIKQMLDSARAVDYLESRTDLVDSERIGMIGHSQGAGTTILALACDPRVKAGVASCGALGGIAERWLRLYGQPPTGDGLWFHEQLELTVPRALILTHGLHEEWLSDLDPDIFFSICDWCVGYGRAVHRIAGSDPSRLQGITFDGPHSFPEDVRKQAYELLDAALGN